MKNSNKVSNKSRHKDPITSWWLQRMTAVILAPLVVWFTVSMLMIARQDHETALHWLQNPFNCIILITFLVMGMSHAALGMNEVWEDYIPNEKTRSLAVLVTKIVLTLAGVIGVVSTLRVAFGS